MKTSRDKMELEEGSLSLLDLPIELDYEIVNQAPYNEKTKIMATLANTCRQFGGQFGFFREELENRAPNQLGKYIEDADIVKAEAMVKANPRLLLRSIEKIVNPDTQQIIVGMTPLQAAYCEGDDEMCLMLEQYFEAVCGSVDAGREEIRKQLEEKFGEEKDEDKESKEVRKNRLATIVQVITNEQFNNGRDAATNKWVLSEAAQIAIATFIEEFIASQPKVIESGRRFRLEILQEVCEAYLQAARQWNYDYKKCALYEDAVFPIVLEYAATNDKQRFAQGLYYLQDKGEKFKRSSTTRDGHNFNQLLRADSCDFLLSGSCVDIIFGGRRGRGRWGVCACRCKTYVEQKLQTWRNLCSHAHERKRLGA